MAGFRNKRFTIYDAMEASGAFDRNPANQTARDDVSGESLYNGPIEYPKTFYSPKGETKITVPGEMVQTLEGVKLRSQQKELITAIAKNADEEAALRAEGWHDHPAKAIHAGGGEAPPTSSVDRIAQLEAELARLQGDVLRQATANALPRVVAKATEGTLSP
jgi:hypothetical protein